MSSQNLKHIKAFVFDVDGVLKKGKNRLNGAKEIITLLNDRNIPFRILTNNPFLYQKTIEERFTTIGLNIDGSKCFGAAHPLKSYLEKNNIHSGSVFFVGEENPDDLFKQFGLFCTQDLSKQDIKAVIMLDDDFAWNNELIAKIFNLLIENPDLPWIVANPDFVFPIEDNIYFPTSGSMAKWIIDLCKLKNVDVEPIYFGKPYTPVYQILEDDLMYENNSLKKSNILMIGDTPGTDILGANTMGWTSALVKTGNYRYHASHSGCKPTFTFNNLNELIQTYFYD